MSQAPVANGEKEEQGNKCVVCGWKAENPVEQERGGLRIHVANRADHPTWDQYMVLAGVNPCDGCNRPLDSMTMDRCYTCRVTDEMEMRDCMGEELREINKSLNRRVDDLHATNHKETAKLLEESVDVLEELTEHYSPVPEGDD